MERVQRTILTLAEAAWPARGSGPGPTRQFRIGPPSIEWSSIAHRALSSPALAPLKEAAADAVAGVNGLSAFLYTGTSSESHADRNRSSFLISFLPNFLASCFEKGAPAFDRRVVISEFQSVATAFETGRASALVRIFLLNCEIEASTEPDKRDHVARMLSPIVPPPVRASKDVVLRAATNADRAELIKLIGEMPSVLPVGFGDEEIRRVRTVLELQFSYQLPIILADEAHNRVALIADLIRLSTNRLAIQLATQWEPIGHPFFGGAADWYQQRLLSAEGEDLDPLVFPLQLEALPRLEERHRLALRRFALALERDEADDRLLDFWIALEALFLVGVGESLAETAARRVAALLSNGKEEYESIRSDLKNSYRLRSLIAHGAPHQRFAAIDAAELTGHYLRQALLRVVADPQGFRPNLLD